MKHHIVKVVLHVRACVYI